MTSLPGPQGFSYSLALLNWDVFATLTFKNLFTESRRWQLAWSHLQDAAKSLSVPYSSLCIALRSEHGEQGGRPHFHYLLGAWEKSNLNLAYALCYWLHRDWCRRSGGMAEVRVYDPRLAGASYVEKCLSGANEYELKKFNKADRLEVSDSVERQILRLRRYETDSAASVDVLTPCARSAAKANRRKPMAGAELIESYSWPNPFYGTRGLTAYEVTAAKESLDR